ncbi:MAG: hypothetical protein ACLQDM_33345, partial [Bradyrhizobium sp.]
AGHPRNRCARRNKVVGTRAARLEGSIPGRCGICMAYDGGADPGPKLALSRAAQRNVFALWVFASRAI